VLRDGRLAVGATGGNLTIVDVDERAVVATLEGHTRDVTALAVLPDGHLASGSWDTTVRLWDVGARVCVATLAGHTNLVISLVALPDGRLASGSLNGTVQLWDIGRRVCIGMLEKKTGAGALALVVLPGSNRLGVLSFDQKLLIWDTRDISGAPTLIPVVELVGSEASMLVVLPGGRLATGGRGVRLWQLPQDVDALLPEL